MTDRFRIGSTTKAFVATVVLQLAAERRLDLDDTVEAWLPGVVRGNGHDGAAMTVRQLLQHTSGVFNYQFDPGLWAISQGPAYLEHRFDRFTPEQLVAIAMTHPPYFAPGAGWVYSNTGYLLAGMIVERVSGLPLAEAIARRIARTMSSMFAPRNWRSIWWSQAGKRGSRRRCRSLTRAKRSLRVRSVHPP